MKKISLFVLLLLCSVSVKIFAQQPPSGGSNKLVLPSFVLIDPAIESMAADISNYIYKKKGGFKWPVTKITFCQQSDNLLVDVTAIDNSWGKLFDPQEDVYGYFIVNNRMFIVASRGEGEVNLNEFFEIADESKNFDMSALGLPVFNNPMWSYKYKDKAVSLVTAMNLEVLEK